ncbi:MAG TPA: PAS domain S-box protein [Pirellulaceae bacterium]|jgi:PAS domain S-box-containing protein|nr:PAS domain S-box protein [Pirellulaceae bacterium]
MDSSDDTVVAPSRSYSSSGHSPAGRGKSVRLEDVLITAELAGRSMRPRSFDEENRALIALAEELALRPQNLLRKLAQTILDLCDGGSAGIAILETDGSGNDQLRLGAVAGRWAGSDGRRFPLDACPSGMALSQGATQLFDRPGRYFPALDGDGAPVYECLVTPIHFEGKAIGTLWAMAHSRERRFDAEDGRLLESLSRFAAAGYRTTSSLNEATAARDELQRRVEELGTAHQALRGSEQRLALLASAVPTLIAALDRDEIYRFCNRAYCEWIGLRPDQVIGRHVRDVLGEEAYRAMAARLEAALAGEPVNFEEKLKLPSGDRKYVLAAYIPERDASGEVVGVYAAASDITDRRRAEERLLASERNFRAMFELAGAGKAQADPHTHRFTRVNRKFCEITGYPERELLRMTWADLTHPEDVEGDWSQIEAVVRGDQASWTREKRYIRKDRRTVWVMISGSVIRDAAGNLSSMVATISDVTSRRVAENAVRESEARYRAIVESQTEMICRFRPSGEILFVNAAYARIRGTTPEALSNASFWDFVEEADRPAVLASLEGLRPQTPSCRIENRFLTSGGPRWTLWTNHVIAFDEAGRPTEVQATGIDVSELREAQEALKSADRRKDEFLAMLGHELRNPLAPIRSGLQLLALDSTTADERGQTLAVMSGQVDHLVRLVDDLLDVSRIVRGRIALQRQPVDLRDVVRRAREVVAGDVASREQVLQIDLPDEPLWAEGDPVRLAQILENLLVNASKYNVRGGRIDLSARREGALVTVRVRDTGIGIDPELLPTLFELFTQAGRSIDRAEGGLGLGLALVQNLVLLHGGTVSAHSDGHDLGSEFTVQLPAIDAPTRIESEPASTGAPRGRRMLLVDDNAAALFVLSKLIAKLGCHEVVTAADGPAALAQAKAARPDIALLDIGLPGMDGLEVARQMRADPDLAGMKLIALTGYGQEEDRRKSQEAGFDRHLVKPVSIDDLRSLLAE